MDWVKGWQIFILWIIWHLWLCQKVEQKHFLLNSIFYISGVAKFCRLKFGWIDLRFSDICFHDYPRIFMKTHFRAVHFLPIYDSNITIGNDKLVSEEVQVLWTKWTRERLHKKTVTRERNLSAQQISFDSPVKTAYCAQYENSKEMWLILTKPVLL